MSAHVLFLSHGGGPLPLMGDPGHVEMVPELKRIAGLLPKPSAILLISAHWEESEPTVTAAAKPALLYDYYGFPPETYAIQYPCPGSPELANEVAQALTNHGMSVHQTEERGLDHGVFVPLTIMYPEADIPCVQLSLTNSLSPQQHLDMGKALRDLDWDNLLVIGSGFSFHNMRAFFQKGVGPDEDNEAFEAWLTETMTSEQLPESEREARLRDWVKAPAARYCHPREEHLMPLHVCYGMAQSVCGDFSELTIIGKKASMYWWSV